MPTHGSPALTQDPHAGNAWSHLIFLERHLLQTNTARASGLAPFMSIPSPFGGELRDFSDLRFVGLGAGEADGPAELVEEPLGSPLDPEFAAAIV